MSLSILPWVFAAAAFTGAMAVVLIALGVAKRRRGFFWIGVAFFVGSFLSAHAAYGRLGRIHDELYRGLAGAKTTNDLLNRLGNPTGKKVYTHDGKTVVCWIYEFKMLEPHVWAQFEMVDGEITGFIGSSASR